jgi:hypothetical protein
MFLSISFDTCILKILNDYFGRILEFLANHNRAFILEVLAQHVSWCELENIAIEQTLLQFTEKGGDDCFDVDKLS